MRWLAITALICFAADQVSKWAVVHGLSLDERGVIEVLPPLLTFRMGWNTGINFGLFADGHPAARWFLVGLAVAISAAVLIWAIRSLRRPVALISAGALIGGALGNALDRVIYGAVADFLNMSCCGIDNPFAFNLADVAVVGGAIGLAFFADSPAKTA